MEPPTVALHVDDSSIEIDTGELIFPTLVLVFCVAYFLDTIGLPGQSMMYAEPLLYVTGVLALTTAIKEGLDFEVRPETEDEGGGGPSRFIGWGSVEGGSANQGSEVDESASNSARARVATGLVVLVAIYVGSLYVIPFTLATVGMLAVALYLLGERSPARIAVYSLGFTLVTWAVFVRWLMVPLP